MPGRLRCAGDKVVGLKQVIREAEAGNIQVLFVAQDADADVIDRLMQAARQSGASVEQVNSRRELGMAAGIEVPSACAAILKRQKV